MVVGVIAKSTDRYLPQPTKSQDSPTYTAVDEDVEIADEEEEPPEPVNVLEETATFEDIIVWGHDILPTNEDPFVKGIEEWISFAEAIHGGQRKDNQWAVGVEKNSA
jgi:ribonuclease H2 subunit C